MTATPNPVTNFITTGDPNDWAASGSGVVAPGSAGAALSGCVALSIYKFSDAPSVVDNLAANTGFALDFRRSIDASGEVAGSVRLRVGNGTSTESLETPVIGAGALSGHNVLVGWRKDASQNWRLYINGERMGGFTAAGYAPSIATFGIGPVVNPGDAGISSAFIMNNVLLGDTDFEDIFDLWRTQGRLFEVIGPSLLNLTTPQWAWEVANECQPLSAASDFGTLRNLGSVGAAGNLTTAVDHDVALKVDQIVNTISWSSVTANAGGGTGSQYSTAGQAGMTAANTPLEMFENVEFDSGDFTVTSATQLTVERAGTYQVSVQAELLETVGAATEDVSLTVEVDGVAAKSLSETIDGTGGSAQHVLNISPFLVTLAENEVVTVDLTLPGGGNTYTLQADNSYILLRRVD